MDIKGAFNAVQLMQKALIQIGAPPQLRKWVERFIVMVLAHHKETDKAIQGMEKKVEHTAEQLER